MRRSASCSETGPARARHRALPRSIALVALVSAYLGTPAKVYMTRERALEVAFGPGAAVERQAVFLTEDQVAHARSLAGERVEIKHALVARYVGRRDGVVVGTAYLDTHRVRTLQETVLVVVGPDGTAAKVEIVAFGEPEDYLPPPAWLRQFDGHALDDRLAVKRDIHGITGATLSAAAVTEATRRVLALHRVIEAEATIP